jgi:hypothetical protein
MQPDCVAAINAFIEQFKPSGLVVCCRLLEYRWLPKRLKLNGAICLEPLTFEEVNKYLAAGGSKLVALREAVDTDPLLQELAQTPLMLSIMSLACQGTDGNELARQKGDSPEERRKQIFGLYVEQMFQRKQTASLGFPKEKIIGWLSWLARKMSEHSQSVFLVEGLQPNWLGTRTQRVAYGTIAALSLGSLFMLGCVPALGLGCVLPGGLTDIFQLICGPVCGLAISVGVVLGCWSDSPVRNGVMSGSICGLIAGLIGGLIYALCGGRLIVGNELANVPTHVLVFGLIWAPIFGLIAGAIGGLGNGPLNHITLVESISWKWNQFWKGTIPGLIVGLICGLIFVLILGVLIFLLILAISKLVSGMEMIFTWLIFALRFGLIVGLIGGVVSGLAGGITDRVMLDKASPNLGIKLSLKNSFAAFLVTWLIGLALALILTGWLIAVPFVKLDYTPSEELFYKLLAALTVGLSVGLNRGGSAVIKHYALRLTLWLNGYTPFKFVKFLDHCARLILLKKVGGGYIFIHRMLLEYFAELSPQSRRGEDGKTGSVGP